MTFSVGAVANHLLDEAAKRGLSISPMKLQKLVYIAHGWHLGLGQGPLIDEAVQAWKYGPVIPSLYHEFKHLGNRPIDRDRVAVARAVGPDRWTLEEFSLPQDGSTGGLVARAVIDRVLEVYGRRTAIELSAMTHRRGTPWSETVVGQDLEQRQDLPISNDVIGSYYRARLSGVESA